MAHIEEHIGHDAAHAHPDNTKAIMRTLGILSIITIVELIVGMFIAPGMIKNNPNLKLWFNIFYLIMTLTKAYYIVANFMHLGHETKNLIMTIIFPLTLFIWFIGAFLWEGGSYKNLRDEHNPKKSTPSAATHSTHGTGGAHGSTTTTTTTTAPNTTNHSSGH
jgi:cytochrome c oxidase subunit IV